MASSQVVGISTRFMFLFSSPSNVRERAIEKKLHAKIRLIDSIGEQKAFLFRFSHLLKLNFLVVDT